MARFGRVLTAMVTPFDGSGGLDLEGAANLARHLVANGNDGVVVAGTTGESATLTHEEQVELVETVVAAIPDHPVVAGAGSNDTRAAVELTEQVTAAGAHGILSVTPYYNRPSQAGLHAHFAAVAAATDLPVLLYDIPIRSGRKIENDTLLRLFEIDNIVGVKDAAGDLASTASLIAEAGGDIDVYSGEDKLSLPLLSVGACGVIGVATHWAGREMQAMIDASLGGRPDDARALNARPIPSYTFETGDLAPNPVPTKVMMNLLAVKVGDCRSPMGVAPPDLADEARRVLDDLRQAT